MRKLRFVGVRFIVFGLAALAVIGLVIFGLWNVLMPAIFGLRAINFWQALGLFLLSRVLFGRFGGWGGRVGKMRFARGWNNLTPEERERFRQAMESHHPGQFDGGGTPEKL